VDSAILGGLFALGGVVLGAGLNELSARMGRRELLAEQREHARHERELAAAEFLDASLVRVSRPLTATSTARLSASGTRQRETRGRRAGSRTLLACASLSCWTGSRLSAVS
jgi:hypothetical protein